MSNPRLGRARGGKGGAEPRRRIRLREIQVLDQMLIGRSQHQIAAALGISQPAVSKIERRIEARLLGDLADKLEHQRARQTLQLRHVYAEAFGAWERSKLDAVRRRQRRTDGGGTDAGATFAEVVAENSHGDPRFLEVARKALADLRAVWGMDAPERIETLTPYTAMSDAALASELALQGRLLGISAPAGVAVAAPSSSTTVDRAQEHLDDAR